MIELSNGHLVLSLHHPEDGFYRGTRFDRSGVFGGISFGGIEFCAPWYDRYDPFMHDAVLGPAEEFSSCHFEQGGPSCHFERSPKGGVEKSQFLLKIGVGLLRLDDSPYDRFRLYEIAEPGEWSVAQTAESVRFCHEMPGYYIYKKEVKVLSNSAFEISHELSSEAQLDGDVYNHNFFTLGLLSTGPGRQIDFPYSAIGDWRARYDSVGLEEFGPDQSGPEASSGFRFYKTLEKGESVYMGNIRAASAQSASFANRPSPFGHTPYEITIRETGLAHLTPTVRIHGSVPVLRSVMWANHRIACIEPYNVFCAIPGHPIRWSIRYDLSL